MRIALALILSWLVTACSPVGTSNNSAGSVSNDNNQAFVPGPSPAPAPQPQPMPQPSPSGAVNPFATTPLKLAAVGDSITRGFNIESFNQESPQYSWSTGDVLNVSVINRLRDFQRARGWNVNVATYNASQPGDTVLDTGSTFLNQVQAITPAQPDVVTVEMGANDLCQGNLSTTAEVTQFRDRIVQVLRTLTQGTKPPKLISLVSIPRVSALTQIPGLANNQVCRIAWSLACPNLSIGLQAFDAQWAAANQALSQAATTLGATVVYDGGAAGATQFTMSDVSGVDCFHPSAAGQGKLAQAVWGSIQGKINQLW